LLDEDCDRARRADCIAKTTHRNKIAWQQLSSRFADGESVVANDVVIAIPFTVLRRADIKVKLPATLRRFIQEAQLGANEKILAGFNQRVRRQPNGFTQTISSDLGFSHCWDASQRQPECVDAELTLFLGSDQIGGIQPGNAQTQG
jgi:monoamine oxidase